MVVLLCCRRSSIVGAADCSPIAAPEQHGWPPVDRIADREPDDGPVAENKSVAFDEDLAVRIRELVGGEAGVTEKRMFRGLAFLIGGNMAISASGQGGALVRVDPDKTVALAGRAHAQIAVMRGRAMPGWLLVDADGLRTRPQLQRWVEEGVAYARSLPEKPSSAR
jgi:hypothetical protein